MSILTWRIASSWLPKFICYSSFFNVYLCPLPALIHAFVLLLREKQVGFIIPGICFTSVRLDSEKVFRFWDSEKFEFELTKKYRDFSQWSWNVWCFFCDFWTFHGNLSTSLDSYHQVKSPAKHAVIKNETACILQARPFTFPSCFSRKHMNVWLFRAGTAKLADISWDGG